jgi:RHS repeat-associated protein
MKFPHRVLVVLVAFIAGTSCNSLPAHESELGDAGIGVAASALSSTPDPQCAVATFQGHEYWFCRQLRSWSAARGRCISVPGMDLARIDSAAENAFIFSNTPIDAWIGASDTVEGAWKWSNNNDQFWNGGVFGSPVGGRYSNWKSGQPDNWFNQDCAAMELFASGKWADRGCGELLEFVCERPLDLGEAEVGCGLTGALRHSPWPGFRRCPAHQGASPLVGAHDAEPYLTYETNGDVESSPAIAADGTIYFGSYDGYLYALNPDLTFKWRYATLGMIRSSPAIAADGTIYVGSNDGKVHAVTPAGAYKWAYTTLGPVRSSPAVGADGRIYVGSDDSRFFALSPTGSKIWEVDTIAAVRSSAAISPDGTIYIGMEDWQVVALNPDGSEKWSYPTLGPVTSSPAIGPDGTVYVGCFDGHLNALHPGSGTLKWSYYVGAPITSSPAVTSDGVVIFGSDDTFVRALHPNGGLKWEYETDDVVISSPAIGADGVVYVGSRDGVLYALNGNDGSELWTLGTDDEIESSPAIGADGKVYVGSDDDRFYAIGTGRSELGEVCDPDNSGAGNRDQQCVSGLVCGRSNGDAFGMSSEVGVCWSPQCENEVDDPSESAVDCGGDCGSCSGVCSDEFCRLGETVLPDPTEVLAFKNGTFERGTWATYQVGANRVEYASSDTLRFEDRGDGHGRVALFEGARTNYLRQSSFIAGPSWLPVSATADVPMTLTLGSDGPDGLAVAELIADEAADGSPRQLVSGPRAAGVVSVWQRRSPSATGDGSASRLHVATSSSSSFLGGGSDWELSANWQRFDARVAATTGEAQVFFAHHEGFPTLGLHSLPEVDFEVWGFQWEDGAFPSSQIPTEESVAVRAADKLTFPSASVPAWMRNGIWQIDVLPEFASTEMVSGRRYTLVSFGGDSDGLYLLDGRVVLRTANTVRLNQTISWARHDKLTITVDSTNARVTIRNASGAQSVHSVSAFTFPAQPVRIGGSYGAVNSEAFARISEPRRVAAASQACVPDADYCSTECPCDEGQGACTSTAECGPRLVCTPNAGARYGLPAAFGVCEHPSCSNPAAAATVCGSTTSRCGICAPGTTPSCAGKSCGSDGAGGSCGEECGEREGGAESSADCESGLVLGIAMGAQFDLPPHLNVCVHPICVSLRPEEIPCGDLADICGRCPASVLHCDGRECSDDGCGTCASGTCSDAGYCAAPATPVQFPPPPGTDLSTAPVGTLPGSFAVNHAGEATYTVPLAVPPGRGGIEPSLALTYNSNRDNGYLGLGWAIEGFSSIARCNRTIAIDGYAEAPQFLSSDAICLDGARLVATDYASAGTDITIDYRLESDKFMRVRGYYTFGTDEVLIGPMYFRAWTKDGRVLDFGGHENGVVYGVDRNEQAQVARWLLRTISDRTNNAMHMLYAHRVNGMTSVHANHGREVEYYPKTIIYGPTERPMAVNFVYDFDTGTSPKRADARSAWRNGTNIHIDHLLERIDVHVDGQVFRQYKLAYDAGTARGEAYLLDSVQQCDASNVCMPPTTFDYDARIPAAAPVLEPLPEPVVPGSSMTDLVAPGGSYSEHRLKTPPIDLNGDGIDDFLYSLTTRFAEEWDDYQYDLVALMSNGRVGEASHDYVHTGVATDFKWAYQETEYLVIPHNTWDWTIASSGPLGVFDYNNDGRTDVMIATRYQGDQVMRYRILSFNGHSFDNIDTGIENRIVDWTPNVYVLDVNGDGFKDVLECGPDSPTTEIAPYAASWRLHVNAQGHGFGAASTRWVASDAPCRKSSLVLDANGDGREELLIKLRGMDPAPHPSDQEISITEPAPPSMLMFFEHDGSVSYFETNARMGRDRDPGHPELADINGDGLLDVLGWSTRLADTNRIWISVSLNRGDGRFAVAEQSLAFNFAMMSEQARRRFLNTNRVVSADWLEARVVDVDRDGKQDLVGRFGPNDVYFSGGHLYNRAADLGLMDDNNLGSVDYDRDYDRDGWPELSFRTDKDKRYPGMPAGFRVVGEARPKLRRITDGYGALVTVSYGLLSDPDVHETELYEADGSAACGYPFVCGLNKSSVVTSNVKEEGIGGRQHWEHGYGGARTGGDGRGFLGFSSRIINEKTITEDVSTTVYSYDNRSRNDLNAFPFAFLPFSRVTYTHLADSEYVELEHREYISTYPYRGTVGDRIVGTHAPLAAVTTRDVVEITDAGPLTLSHEREEVALYNHIYGNVLGRTQILSDDETRYLLTGYQHLDDNEFVDAWLINHPVLHVDRYVYEGKQEVAKSSSFEYYPNGKLFRTSDETGLTRSWSYNDHGGVTEERHIGVTEGTRIQSIDWDALDEYPTEITNAENHETEIEFDRRFGQVAWTKDQNDLLTTRGYDNFGRLKAVSRPDGSAEGVSYFTGDATLPLVIEQRAATGERVLTSYDIGGRPTERTSWDFTGKELVESVWYDSRGRVYGSTLPTTPSAGAPSLVATHEYDNLDRLVRQQGPEGDTRSCYHGLVMCTENGRGSTSCNVRDARGRVAWVTKPVFLGCEAAMSALLSLDGVGYTYQAFNLPHQITDNGRTTTITVDAIGRKVASDDPDRGDESFGYTTFGELREYTNGNGEISSFYYDDLGRLTERRDWAAAVGGPFERSVWEWDGGASLDASELIGSLTRTESFDDVVRSYRYNARGLLEQETLAIDGDSFVTTMTWDPYGRLGSVEYPALDGVSPFTLGYEYAPSASGSGGLKSIHNLSFAYGNEVYWTATSTDVHGRLAEEVMGNGGSRSRSWYSSGRLETLTTREAGGSVVQQMEYNYDAVGNLESQVDALGQQSGFFSYDALDRLRVEQTSSPRTYDYDVDGNLALPGFEYGDPQPHALSADGTFAYDYDGAGRRHLKRRPDGSGQAVEYAHFDLPREVRSLAAGGVVVSTVALSYDSNGSRVRKRSPDEEVSYSGGLEYRRFFDGRPSEHVFYVTNGEGVVAQVTAKPGSASSTAYLHTNRLGTPAAVEEGGAIRRIRQDAFGWPISVDGSSDAWSAPTSIGFTGHETDSELELINMSGRIYDPRARQFLTTDPIVAAPFVSLDLHPYAYAWGNPLKYVDPTGWQEVDPLTQATIEGADGIAHDQPITVSVTPPASTPTPQGQPVSDAVSSPLGSEGFGGDAGSTLSAAQLGATISNHDPTGASWGTAVYTSFADGAVVVTPAFGDQATADEGMRNERLGLVLGSGLWAAAVAPSVLAVESPGAFLFFSEMTLAETAGVAAVGVGAARGGSVGAMKAGETFLNWSWKSTSTFRHTFLHHGEGAKVMRSLTDTAREGGPQGQWLNNEAAAQFLAAQRPYVQGPASMAIPKGLGHVIMPDGSVVQATRATLVPSANGGFVTAYPIP